jgi:hypothetical protein
VTDRAQYERFRRRRPLVLVGPRDLRPLCPARGRRGPFEFGDAGSRDAWVAVRAYHGLGARRHGGFLVKYLLDKRFVFLDGYDGHVAELRKVRLYGVFSVGTTVLFWAVEFSLWYGTHGDPSKQSTSARCPGSHSATG